MWCKSCGGEVEEGRRFCPKCGTPAEPGSLAPEPPPVPAPAAPPSTEAPPAAAEPPVSPSPPVPAAPPAPIAVADKAKSRLLLLSILGVAGLLFLCCFCGILASLIRS
jgi:hypothetical protein